MPFKKFATKKGNVPRKDEYFDRETPNPLPKPEPAKRKNQKAKLRMPK